MKNAAKFQIYFLLFRSGIAKTIIVSNMLIFIALQFLHNNLHDILPSLIILLPIVASSNHIDSYFYKDQKSGALDFLLITHELNHLIFAKICAILLMLFLAIASNYLLADIASSRALSISFKNALLVALPIMINTSAILTLAGTMRIYLDKNTNILSIAVLTLILPPMILCGLYLNKQLNVFLYLLTGITMVMTPLCFFLTNLLLKELYNN